MWIVATVERRGIGVAPAFGYGRPRSRLRRIADARPLPSMQRGVVNAKEAKLAELELLRTEWREALLAARQALRAEEGVLPPEEVHAHARHLRHEYKAVVAGLRQYARDEGLSPELAEPFLPGGFEVHAEAKTSRGP